MSKISYTKIFCSTLHRSILVHQCWKSIYGILDLIGVKIIKNIRIAQKKNFIVKLYLLTTNRW